MTGTLYMLPNRISESDVNKAIPTYVQEMARTLSTFFVEDAKSARHYLKVLEHPQPIASLTIEEIGHHPDSSRVDAWLAPVLKGTDAAILSESGCPGVADPGAQLVARAQALGIRVVPWVGPSSLLLTLMASGLDGQHFAFAGYLPQKPDERVPAIRHLEKRSQQGEGETQLFIETPYRNQALFESLCETLQPGTRLTVATDVTGDHERIRTLTIEAWRALNDDEKALPKLPTVFALLGERREKGTRGSAPAAKRHRHGASPKPLPRGKKPARGKVPH